MRRTMLLSAIVVPATLLIVGVAYARTIDCTGGDCTGTNKADTMNGSPNDDRMLALDGPDTLYGLGGMDALKGKGGADRVDGGEGNDIVRGGTHGVANDHAR